MSSIYQKNVFNRFLKYLFEEGADLTKNDYVILKFIKCVFKNMSMRLQFFFKFLLLRF